MTRRLGWLGPLIVLVGAAAAAFGIWWMSQARSQADKFVDAFALDGETALVVRSERSSARSFLELRHFDGAIAWQAMVPPYAGRVGAPGLAASRDAASVRVVRNNAAEVFGMAMRNAAKLGGFKIASDRPADALGHTLPAAVTLTDLRYSFELVGQEASASAASPGVQPWAAIAAVDLATGKKKWDVDLGAAPITAAGITDRAVWVQQGGQLRGFATADGAPVQVAVTPPDLAAPIRELLTDGDYRVFYDRKSRELRVTRGAPQGSIDLLRKPWPADAVEPWPYHLAGGRLWIVFPDRVDTLVLPPVGAR
jgi:hypothetical protein